MPYKDTEVEREKARERKRKSRLKNVTPFMSRPKYPHIEIPERVFICRVPGHLCSLSRHEFIKCLEASNRSNESKLGFRDRSIAEEIIG